MRSAYSSNISKFLFSAVDNLIIILIFSCVGPDNVGHLFKLWHIDCDILSDKDVWSSRCLMIQDFLELFCWTLWTSDFALLRSLDAVSNFLDIQVYWIFTRFLWVVSLMTLIWRTDGKRTLWWRLLCRIYGRTWERNDGPIIFCLLCSLFYQFVLF